MNDNELSSMVREAVADIRSPTPVEAIISRGHAVREWRRLVPAAAGALVVAGAAVLGVTALAPSGHPAPAAAGKAGSHPAVVRLAAWTVTRQANGDIDVTIRQLQHPAQLQATLRADGLPAHVSFSGHPDRVCQPYSAATLTKLPFGLASWWLSRSGGDVATTLHLHPSQLPSGAGMSFSVAKVNYGRPFGVKLGLVRIALVDASRQCTG